MLILRKPLIYILACYSLLYGLPGLAQTTDSTKYPASLKPKAKQAMAFCKANNYNLDFCILIDLSLHSGLKRFFLWDFKSQTVSGSYLVSHGCGTMPWSWAWSKEKAVLSNADGSHCSSAWKYKIGKRGYSNWGIHVNYKLFGLDRTNSNAYARQIVFHSWEKVPDDEVYPKGTPEGWGCPAISNAAMRIIDPKLKASKEPVLMWVYK
ncbi:MAG: murein L,D-transpeptidase catalytic domain family protein [Sphingobacteriaceae bacterium]|nr:murein L,D-transpeptidase catalytic domain family protein [Sphingobacteriaceae bacterium]